jgi:hypothetical protein
MPGWYSMTTRRLSLIWPVPIGSIAKAAIGPAAKRIGQPLSS